MKYNIFKLDVFFIMIYKMRNAVIHFDTSGLCYWCVDHKWHCWNTYFNPDLTNLLQSVPTTCSGQSFCKDTSHSSWERQTKESMPNMFIIVPTAIITVYQFSDLPLAPPASAEWPPLGPNGHYSSLYSCCMTQLATGGQRWAGTSSRMPARQDCPPA